MSDYGRVFLDAVTGYARWVLDSILHPSLGSFVWWLLGLSLLVWLIEITLPWRRSQRVFRRDFWLDAGQALEYGLVNKVVVHRKDLA